MTENRLRVLVSRRWPARVEAELQRLYDVTLNDSDVPLSADAFRAALKNYDVICPTVSDKLPREVLSVEGRRTKLLGNFGVGVDHIDLAAARELGIAVSNTPGVLTEATADCALTLLLMVARRAEEGARELRAGHWTGWRPTHLVGMALEGKTLGLVGYGRIAKAFARKCHLAFGMKVRFYARRPMAPEPGDVPAEQARDLDDLLASADVVSLHVPGGAETRGLFGADTLAKMKPGAVLINTARGEIVDHAALASALKAGTIGGAGLDVFPAEPAIPEGLLDAPNLVMLPHLGSATVETREAMGFKVLANVAAFAAGQPLPDPV